MPPKVADLETLLASLAAAHRELCETLDLQHAAMKRFDTAAMTAAARRQESIHRRILRQETARRRLVLQIAQSLRLPGDVGLVQLAHAIPQRTAKLLELRDQLRKATTEAAERTRIASRFAGSVLTHLNHALRLLVDADQRTGVYVRSGAPHVPRPRPRLDATV